MKKTITIGLCALFMNAPNIHAAEFTGGSADFGYSAFLDDTDVSRLALRGQAELGFDQNFAMQMDIGTYNFGFINDSGTNIGLHAIYHVNHATSLGVFYARDNLAGGNGDVFGVEAGFDFSNTTAGEAYFSTGDSQGIDANIYGFDLAHYISDAFQLRAGVDFVDSDLGFDLTRWAFGVEYQSIGPANYYAELGSLDANALGLAGSEAFLGFGVRLDFGMDRGATFGQRGLLDLLPGL